jgi:phosphate transport system substrate-binding protein
MKNIVALPLVLLTLVLAVGAATGGETITVKGSDTMVILAQRWAEKYMTAHPDVTIQVTGGGSGTGLSALINGTTDIANASRPMKRSEMEKLKQRFSSLGVEVKVAKDGLSVYVNDSNPVKELTLPQIKDIYTGKINNWKEVGGPDGKIILYSRENNSGTYVFFKEHVLENEDFATRAQNLPGTASVVNAVSKDKMGIGYGGAAYASGIKTVLIKKDDSSPAIAPTEETVLNDTYPISRYLYMYLKSKPTGALKAYIDWILGAEGQDLVSQVGYFRLKK